MAALSKSYKFQLATTESGAFFIGAGLVQPTSTNAHISRDATILLTLILPIAFFLLHLLFAIIYMANDTMHNFTLPLGLSKACNFQALSSGFLILASV